MKEKQAGKNIVKRRYMQRISVGKEIHFVIAGEASSQPDHGRDFLKMLGPDNGKVTERDPAAADLEKRPVIGLGGNFSPLESRQKPGQIYMLQAEMLLGLVAVKSELPCRSFSIKMNQHRADVEKDVFDHTSKTPTKIIFF
jgi:hypothetical protein